MSQARVPPLSRPIDVLLPEMAREIAKVVTPHASADLLRSIQAAKPRVYSIVFVGVNGVGKSTNLAKIAFWLLQNGISVLIAAGDTFRSGAVEQLRVHVRALGGRGRIELFERGYGKDAAAISRDAIAHGSFPSSLQQPRAKDLTSF